MSAENETVYLRRLLWRCRRGMLELDLLLANFVTQHYPALEMYERQAFEDLLEMPDTELWDMITGKLQPENAAWRLLLHKINQINRDQPDNVGDVNG